MNAAEPKAAGNNSSVEEIKTHRPRYTPHLRATRQLPQTAKPTKGINESA
jgi:hypothetical protein